VGTEHVSARKTIEPLVWSLPPLNWLQRIRLRLLAVMLGLFLAALATLSLTTLPAWPVVGVAFAVAVAVINTAGQRFSLDQQICLTCGVDVSKQPSGPHGVICPKCGGLSQSLPTDEPPTSRNA
jgi:hypothetical protein